MDQRAGVNKFIRDIKDLDVEMVYTLVFKELDRLFTTISQMFGNELSK